MKHTLLTILSLLLIVGCTTAPQRQTPIKKQPVQTERVRTNLSIKEQKEIYYELVKIQDSGRYTPQATYNVLATRYNISSKKVKEIAVKGIKADWERP